MTDIPTSSLFAGLDFILRTLTLVLRDRDPEAYETLVAILRDRLADEPDLGMRILLESYVKLERAPPTFTVIQGGKDDPANSQ